MKNQWSAKDQAELDALVKRRDAFNEEARKPLYDVAAAMNLALNDASGGAPPAPNPQRPHRVVVERLIAFAGTLRDALEPFDSNTRARSAGE
jgi:hypothetical protein